MVTVFPKEISGVALITQKLARDLPLESHLTSVYKSRCVHSSLHRAVPTDVS